VASDYLKSCKKESGEDADDDGAPSKWMVGSAFEVDPRSLHVSVYFSLSLFFVSCKLRSVVIDEIADCIIWHRCGVSP